MLLSLSFFKTSHEATFLFGLFGVFAHCGTYFFFVNHLSEDESLNDGDEKRKEVVVAEASGVVVEEHEEHQRHEVHHPFHARHCIVVRLSGHVDACVDDVYGSHEQTEEADVVAKRRGDEGNVGSPADDGVGRREVFSPEERLASEFDCRGEEVEHGYEYRHLQEHRETTREWAGSGTRV